MDTEHRPGRGVAIYQEPTAEEKWRAKQPVFTTLTHSPEGTMGRNTSIAPGAEIEASDRFYAVDRTGSLRRSADCTRGLSKKERRALRRQRKIS